MTTHPMQPIEMDDGVARFKENKIVRYLLTLTTNAHLADMNTLAIIPFSVEDRVQFAQLIGYSVSGFGDLDYVPRDVVTEADAAAQHILENKQ